MEHVVIGMDPHKRSVTIEVMTGTEQVLAKHRFETTAAGFRQLLDYAKQWPDRLWAVEGCNGIGRHVASRLVITGETVVDVPPKLSARLRMFDTRQGRKTDPDDAHAIAMVAVLMNGLRAVVNKQHALLRILADRRRPLGEDHTRMISQVHQLLLELIPGGRRALNSGKRGECQLSRCLGVDGSGGLGSRHADSGVCAGVCAGRCAFTLE